MLKCILWLQAVVFVIGVVFFAWWWQQSLPVEEAVLTLPAPTTVPTEPTPPSLVPVDNETVVDIDLSGPSDVGMEWPDAEGTVQAQ